VIDLLLQPAPAGSPTQDEVIANGHKGIVSKRLGSRYTSGRLKDWLKFKNSEDTESCREFFQDLRRRGLPDPLLVVSDGAPASLKCYAFSLELLKSEVPEFLKYEVLNEVQQS
jgi:hypothetical protein